MDSKSNKEHVAWLKNEIYHNEVLLKFSLRASEDRSESLSELFLAQAERIQSRISGLQKELDVLTKKKKKRKKK